jgi:hypothetical protein
MKLMDAPKLFTDVDYNFVNEVKEKSFETLLYQVNLSNGLYSDASLASPKCQFQKKTGFKAYVCKGNNGHIIKTILKKRWWWTLTDKCDPDEWDFIWTQWFKPKVLKSIELSTQSSTLSQTRNVFKFKDTKENSFKKSWVYGKVSQNFHLSNKKNLFLNLRRYYMALGKDPIQYIPLTYLIKNGPDDISFKKFLEETKHLPKSTVSLTI